MASRLFAGANAAAAYVQETRGIEVNARSIYHLVEIGRLKPIRPSGNPKGKAYFDQADLDRIYSAEPNAAAA